MSTAGRAVPMKVGPLDEPSYPSTISIDISKYAFLQKAKPGDGLFITICATVESIRLGEDESRLQAEIQEITPAVKKEKEEPVNGIYPK